MAGRIVRAEVIDRFHESSPQEMRPGAVDERRRHRQIVGGGDELAELGAAVHIRPLTDLAAVEKLGERDPDHPFRMGATAVVTIQGFR